MGIFFLAALAILLGFGYSALPKTAPGGCSGYPAKNTNVGDNNVQCVGGATPPNPTPPNFKTLPTPSKPASISGTQSPAQGSSEPLSDLPLSGNFPPPIIFSADRSVNGWQNNPNMVDGLPFNPVTGRAAGNVLAPQPTMYSAPTDLVDPTAASDVSNVDYSD